MKKALLLLLFAYLIVGLMGGGAFADFPVAGGGTTNASDLSSGTLPPARIGDNSILPIKLQKNSGTAGATTYYRGDGAWATPTGTGDVVGPASATNSNLASYDNATGKLLKDSGVAPSTDNALGTSDAILPTQKAVKQHGDATYAPISSTSTATDWNKWDGGATGLVAATGRTSLGLGNVDNTSDANKPISTATQSALDAKQAIVAWLTLFISQCTMGADNVLTCPAFNTGTGSDGTRGIFFRSNTSASCSAGDNAIKFISDNTFRFCKNGVLYTPLDNGSGAWIGGSTSALNFSTTGTVTGAISILDNQTSPTAAQSYGTLNIVTGTPTVLLPTAVAGMSMCVQDGGATHDNVIVDVQAGDNVVLVGVTQAGGVGITNASGTSLGDYVCLVATAANRWRVFGKQGTWASQ